MTLKERLITALKSIFIVDAMIDEPLVGGSMIAFLLNDAEEKVLEEYLDGHRTLLINGYSIYFTRPNQYYPKWIANFVKK